MPEPARGMPAAPPAEGLDADADLIPRDPPPRVARMLSLFLIAVFVGLVAFAAFVPLPESVRCEFVLASEGGAAPVMAPEAGMVDQVLVQLGQAVHAGQPLLSLQPYVMPASSPSEMRARVEKLDAELHAAVQVDAQLALRHDSRVQELRSDLSRAGGAATAARARVQTLGLLSEQLVRAAAEGAVSQRELLERRQEQQEAEFDLAQAQRSASAAQRALDATESALSLEISERDLLRGRLTGELAEARAALLQVADAGASSGDVIAILAPHDGVIVSLGAERPGIIVERGQALAAIARSGGRIRAEIAIPERGAARITQGLPVRLLFDAYPYTRHGVVSGLLTWVSPAAQGGTLSAFARLSDASVIVDDQRRPLLPGMSGEARIDIGSRTVLEYVFEPLRQMREALSAGAESAR